MNSIQINIYPSSIRHIIAFDPTNILAIILGIYCKYCSNKFVLNSAISIVYIHSKVNEKSKPNTFSYSLICLTSIWYKRFFKKLSFSYIVFSSLLRAESSSIATASVVTSPLFLLSNICNLVPFRLDSGNYVPWKFQVYSILKVHSLFGHIEESLPKPTNEDSPEYLQWIFRDQALITLINATLSPSTFAHVGCTSSRDL